MDSEKIEHDDRYFLRPSIIDRFKAMTIDAVVLVVLLWLAFIFISTINIESGFLKAVTLFLVILYEPILVVHSQTVGQRLLHLKVIKQSTYLKENMTQKIDIISSLARYLVKLFLGIFSLLTIHSDSYGRAIHDHVSGSIIVYD